MRGPERYQFVADHFDVLKTVLKVGLALVTSYYFHLGALFPVLLVCIALDMAFGIGLAAMSRNLTSNKAWSGALKKSMELGLVVMADVIEPAANNLPISDAVCAFYIWHEGLSIVEKAALAGLPVPKALRDALAIFNRGGDSGQTGGKP